MARLRCSCGILLRNTSSNNCVQWEAIKLSKFKRMLNKFPDESLYKIEDLIYEESNGQFQNDIWYCDCCRNIYYFDQEDKCSVYEIYKQNNVKIDEILKLEEWIAICFCDTDYDINAKYVLENFPFRPYRFFTSKDYQKIYVYNIKTNLIDFNFRLTKKEKPTRNIDIGLNDCFYGLVLGDMLNLSSRNYKLNFETKGKISNYTLIMVATCKSLKDNNKRLDIYDIKHKYDDLLKAYNCKKVYTEGITLIMLLPLIFIDYTKKDIEDICYIFSSDEIVVDVAFIFLEAFKKYFKDCEEILNNEEIYENRFNNFTFALDEISYFKENSIEIKILKNVLKIIIKYKNVIVESFSDDGYSDLLIQIYEKEGLNDLSFVLLSATFALFKNRDYKMSSLTFQIKYNDLIQDSLF